MKNGLGDIAIVSFVFTPLVVTVAVLLFIWWVRTRDSGSTLDRPARLLAATVRLLPEERRDWGAAMLAELSHLESSSARWWFALGCIRVTLFPPHHDGVLQHAAAGRSPGCGMLAVTLPPMGLPFIYFTTLIVEAIGGSPFTQSSRWSDPDAVIAVVSIIVKLTVFCLLAGVPLGLAGLLRRERLRRLSVMGMISSLCIISYFIVVMHFTAGGPNGD
jgi:hypothetical protein